MQEEIIMPSAVTHNIKNCCCIKSSVFWDITPRSPLKVNRRFGGAYRPYLQGQRISQARNQRDAVSKHSDCYLRRRLTFNGLHGVICQKVELFITTAVREPQIPLYKFPSFYTGTVQMKFVQIKGLFILAVG
jgi:hypothetical protein